MNQHSTLNQIGALLIPAVAITIAYQYVPQDLEVMRAVLSAVQLGCILGVAAVAVRSLLREF
ncbi:MAG TPA: hypothetical protein VMT30_07210 [Candidatus Saccharimonadia bacterium]|nr:hypothetical protein [Candidatus Saccharimonadia bacterium]